MNFTIRRIICTCLIRATLTTFLVLTGISTPVAKNANVFNPVINDRPESLKFGEYSEITLPKEKVLLKKYAAEIRKVRGAQGYILFYDKRVGGVGNAKKRAERAKKYLVNDLGLERVLIVTADCGYRGKVTVELWIKAAEAAPPYCIDR